MVQHRPLQLGSEHHSKSTNPRKTDPSISSRVQPQPLLFPPPLPIKSPGHTLIRHRNTQELQSGWLQLKMILCSGDNHMSNIDTPQTLHLAKVSDGRVPNTFRSTLLFPWKSATLAFVLKGAQSRPAHGFCVCNFHLTSCTSRTIYP